MIKYKISLYGKKVYHIIIIQAKKLKYCLHDVRWHNWLSVNHPSCLELEGLKIYSKGTTHEFLKHILYIRYK